MLGISGDFGFNPIALEDRYGVSVPLELNSVKTIAKKTNYYTNEVVPPKPAPPLILQVADSSAMPAAPSKSIPVISPPPVSTSIPKWAQIALVAGAPVGLAYSILKGKGILGIAAWTLLLGYVGTLPVAYYIKKAQAEKTTADAKKAVK